jgi:hypothetical protein
MTKRLYDRIVPLEGSGNFSVHECLATLGVSLLSEWDVLVFLYRHGASLNSVPQIIFLGMARPPSELRSTAWNPLG